MTFLVKTESDKFYLVKYVKLSGIMVVWENSFSEQKMSKIIMQVREYIH